jgi:hypothetical protein
MDDINKANSQNFAGETPSSMGTAASTTSATGVAARMKEQAANKAADLIGTATDLHRRAADKLEDTRQTAAGKLACTASNLHTGVDQVASTVHSRTDQLASKLHSRADQVSGLGHSAADGLQSAAEYIRDAKLSSIGKDLEGVVKQYPMQSLAAAAFVGFLLARGFGRRD